MQFAVPSSCRCVVVSQTNHTITKSALACEISSLRYALLVNGEEEDAIALGWDAGIVEDEDGT